MPEQGGQLAQLVQEFADVFSELPGKALGTIHKIVIPEGTIVRERWQWIPYHWYPLVKEEIKKMLEQDIIQEP